MSNPQTKAWMKASLIALGISFFSAVALNIRAGYLADEYAGNGEEFVGATKNLAEWSVYFFLLMLTVNVSLAIIKKRLRKPQPM